MSEYDRGDSQIKRGVLARSCAASLQDAETALELAIESADEDDIDVLREMQSELEGMKLRYRQVGDAL